MWIPSICTDPLFTSSNICPFICMLDKWPWLDSVDKNFAFVRADFNAVITDCFIQPFNELLQLFFAASQKTDIVSKPKVAKWSSSKGH